MNNQQAVNVDRDTAAEVIQKPKGPSEVEQAFDKLSANFNGSTLVAFISALLRSKSQQISAQPGAQQEIAKQLRARAASGGNGQALFPGLRGFPANVDLGPRTPLRRFPTRAQVLGEIAGEQQDVLKKGRDDSAAGPQVGDLVQNAGGLQSADVQRQFPPATLAQLRGSKLSFNTLHGMSVLTTLGAMSVQQFLAMLDQTNDPAHPETIADMREKRSMLEAMFHECKEHRDSAYRKADYYAKNVAFHAANGVPAFRVPKHAMVDFLPQFSQLTDLLNGARQQAAHKIETYKTMALNGVGPEYDAGFIAHLVDHFSRGIPEAQARQELLARGIALEFIDGKPVGKLVDAAKLEKARRLEHSKSVDMNMTLDKLPNKPESLSQKAQRLEREAARRKGANP